MAKIFDKKSKKILRSLRSLRMTGGKGVNIFSRLFPSHHNGCQKDNVTLNSIQSLLRNRFRLAGRNDRGKYFQSPPLAGGEVKGRGKKTAFTLAETLITLGIIGVVAALTIPTLITNYQKHQTETQLVKFYSMINQTLRMSVAENGDPEGWITPNKAYTYDENVEFLKTYIFPYMKHLGYKQWPDQESNNNKLKVITTLMDGGVMTFRIDVNGGDIAYYTDEKWLTDTTNIQRHMFSFQFAKKTGNNENINSLNYIEPYIFEWDGTRENLINNNKFGCNKNINSIGIYGYCTKLIQMNSWKIPSNYPW